MGAVTIDSETTGFSTTAQVVSLAIVDWDGTTLFNELIRPSIPIPEEASRIHGIYDSDVSELPTFDKWYSQILECLRDSQVIGYNLKFDLRLLDQTCDAYQLEPLSRFIRKQLCCMREYAYYNRLLKPIMLERALSIEGYQHLDAHTALGDALGTLYLARQLWEFAE